MKKSSWEVLKEMVEATDDQGRPLRTADPFAPPVIHKAATSNPGSAGVFQKSQVRQEPNPQAAKNAPDSRKTANYVKPSYPGKYVGQSVTTNDKTTAKNVAWKDKFTGDPRYGKVQSMQKATMVWDGNDWIPKQEFDYKASARKLPGQQQKK